MHMSNNVKPESWGGVEFLLLLQGLRATGQTGFLCRLFFCNADLGVSLRERSSELRRTQRKRNPRCQSPAVTLLQMESTPVRPGDPFHDGKTQAGAAFTAAGFA